LDKLPVLFKRVYLLRDKRKTKSSLVVDCALVSFVRGVTVRWSYTRLDCCSATVPSQLFSVILWGHYV